MDLISPALQLSSILLFSMMLLSESFGAVHLPVLLCGHMQVLRQFVLTPMEKHYCKTSRQSLKFI